MFKLYVRLTRMALNLADPYTHAADNKRPRDAWSKLKAHLYLLRNVLTSAY